MIESYPLITTIVASVALAFLLGLLANYLRLPSILGYLLSGMMLGPNTPGFVADINLAEQLAEIGVILLMFGVGLHFSINDLKKVRNIALPGAIIQMIITTILCCFVIMLLNYKFTEGLVFGITLSVASTVVLLRTLQQYGVINSYAGKVAIGWLIVEDIAMVLVLVLLPAFSEMFSNGEGLNLYKISAMVLLAIIKMIAFVMVMIIFGKKLLPKLLTAIAKTKSQELVVLGTIAISSGFAFIAYTVFGTSFALGAFMAGFVLNESKVGRKYAEKSVPLRDIFAVLFFVSAGMLFNPMILFKHPVLILASCTLVIFGKAIVAYFTMKILRQKLRDSLILAVSLAQIGEFSFILAAMALRFGIFPDIVYDMVIASAIISIAINPFLFKLAKVGLK